MSFERGEESETSKTDVEEQLVDGEELLNSFSPLLNSMIGLKRFPGRVS